MNLLSASLPPGPPGKWKSTWRALSDPRSAFKEWSREYGDPYLVPALNGAIAMTGRPDLIKQIFGADPSLFAAFAADTLRPILGSGSLLLMDGAMHKRERKLVMPMFHGDRMRAYGKAMQEVAIATVQRHVGQHVRAIDVTTAISQEVIVRAVFGAQNRKRIDRLLDATRNIVRRSSPMLFYSKRMQFSFAGWSPWDQFLAAQHDLHEAFDAELAVRENSSEGPREDILSLLSTAKYEDGSAITTSHLRDELFTFLFAGHETSAIAMAWAIEHLNRNPETLLKLLAELKKAPSDAPEDLVQLPYLKAVVQETLRLFPIVTEVIRLLKEPMPLGDYVIPAGCAVSAAAILTHYDPTIYPDPETFRPDRFLERSFSPFEYFPFGGGHRRCVGAAFASYEMQIVLGSLFRQFVFELTDREPARPVRRNITMGPSSGVPIRIKRVR